MKKKRLKPQPLATREDFFAGVDTLLNLEAIKRKLEAQRDLERQKVDAFYADELASVEATIKGVLALAEAYADAHRAELLPDKTAKSFKYNLAQIGWRTGNRKVDTMSRVTVENAINALKAIGLGAFVASKEEINKAKILIECKDDKTIAIEVTDEKASLKTYQSVPLANAGLKITQAEGFYIEPAGPAADTLKPAEAAA